MSRNPKTLTIHHAQTNQPWTVPYRKGLEYAQSVDVPHIKGTHDVLHLAKSLGKLAAVFEALDHAEQPGPSAEQDAVIRAMAADLVTGALRLGNLYDFSVAEELVKRVREKNDTDIVEWPTAEDAKELAAAAVVAMNAQEMLNSDIRAATFYEDMTGDHRTPWNELNQGQQDYWRSACDAAGGGWLGNVSDAHAAGCKPGCACTAEPEVARFARESALEGGGTLIDGMRKRPSGVIVPLKQGANGMVEGDLIEDTLDGFRGEASDFTQDGDVTIISGTGIHKEQRFAKWARCVGVPAVRPALAQPSVPARHDEMQASIKALRPLQYTHREGGDR